MKYNFRVYKYNDAITGIERKIPTIDIEESLKYGRYFIDEISNLYSNLDYVKEIVIKLESLLKGEALFYEGFGFEVYMIECTKEVARVKNIFEDDQIEAEIPTQEVYQLMKDWRDYLEKYYNDKDQV
jgi:hypothetical protein